MAAETILALIDAEIDKLKQVRAVLANASGISTKLSGAVVKKAAGNAKTAKKHVLSPEARKRIADAQRKRWAAHRAKSKAKAK